MSPEPAYKRLSALRHTLEVLAGDSEHLRQLVVELLSRMDRRAGYHIEEDPSWGDLAAAIRQARSRREQ